MDILGTQTALKMAIFGRFQQILKLGSTTCDTCSRPPPLSFWLIFCAIVLNT